MKKDLFGIAFECDMRGGEWVLSANNNVVATCRGCLCDNDYDAFYLFDGCGAVSKAIRFFRGNNLAEWYDGKGCYPN